MTRTEITQRLLASYRLLHACVRDEMSNLWSEDRAGLGTLPPVSEIIADIDMLEVLLMIADLGKPAASEDVQ